MLAYLRIYFQIKHNSKFTIVDATSVDKIGRLINHSRRHDNAKPEKRILEDKVHILICAKEDIQAGTEILFDYGDVDSSLPDCVPGCVYCMEEGRTILQVSTSTGSIYHTIMIFG